MSMTILIKYITENDSEEYFFTKELLDDFLKEASNY